MDEPCKKEKVDGTLYSHCGPLCKAKFAACQEREKLKKDIADLKSAFDSLDADVQANESGLVERAQGSEQLAGRVTALEESSAALGADAQQQIDKLATRVQGLEDCTTIVHGIDLCRVPKYEKTLKPLDMTINDLMHPTEDFCMQMERLDDAFATVIFNPKKFGDLDIPDNYVCMKKDAITNYVDALVPAHMQAVAIVESRGMTPRDLINNEMDRRAKQPCGSGVGYEGKPPCHEYYSSKNSSV